MIFRLVMILAAGFALVAIISVYGKSVDGESFDAVRAPRAVGQIGPAYKFDGGAAVTGSDLGTTLESAPAAPPQRAAAPHAPAHADRRSGGGAKPGARDALRPEELLPRLGNTPEEQLFARVNPAGQGDVRDQNFLNAGFHIGHATGGGRNKNRQLRSEPLIIPTKVSPFLNTALEPNPTGRVFEIGSASSV